MKTSRSFLARAAVLLLGAGLLAVPAGPAAAVGGPATDWLRDARFGVMNHYLAEGCPFNYCNEPAPTAASWNTRVNGYDTAGVVSQLKEIGAGYLVLAVGQNSGYWAAPNSEYDRIVTPTAQHPSRLSTRDVIAEMGTALHAAGLKLIVYVPVDAPVSDDYARQKLGGPASDGEPNSSVYQQNWLKILTKWSTQWGAKVDGWWADGAWREANRPSIPATPYPNLGSYYTATAAAMRAGNPNALVGLNPGWYSLLPRSDQPVSDFLPGEVGAGAWPNPHGVNTRFVNDRGTQLQTHFLAAAQGSWGALPDSAMTMSDDQIMANTQKTASFGGVVTWDVGHHRATGKISDAAVAQLKKVGQVVGKLPTRLVGAGSGRCVNVPGANSNNGTDLGIYDCVGSVPQQQWTFNPANGEVRSLGKCLDVEGGSSADGTPVQLWDCANVDAQKWTYDPFTKQLKAFGKCLDVSGGYTVNDSKLIIWPCHGRANQQWRVGA